MLSSELDVSLKDSTKTGASIRSRAGMLRSLSKRKNQTIGVLVVEDDPCDVEATTRMLRKIRRPRFAARFVDNLQATLEELKTGSFQVLLLDLGLAEEQGLDTLRLIRAQNRSIPIVVMTGLDDEETALEALENGAQDYLVKGAVTEEVLSRALRYAMQRQQLWRQLEAANRAKGAFLANFSHEIRTPMTSILGFAELLSDSTQDPDTRQALTAIRRNGEYLLDLLNDVLDFSKCEAERMIVEQAPCSPREIAESVRELLLSRAQAKGLPLEIAIDPRTPETILGDPTRLRQVLLNLAGNAVKFTEHGGVYISVAPQQPNGNTICFEIRDTGIGISEEQQKLLFQPFVQADSATSRTYGGTGLGLAISKRLAELMHGTIEMESEAGVGTTFRVRLPVHLPTESDRDAKAQANAVTTLPDPPRTARGQAMLQGKVLLAEDGVDNQRLISLLLTKAGAQVEVADNGRVAVEMARRAEQSQQPYDLILMDMQMPVLDGCAAVRELRKDDYRRPIVALTAHDSPQRLKECLEAGCGAYLRKPLTRSQLLELVVQFCPAPLAE